MTVQIAEGTEPREVSGDVHFTLDMNGVVQKFVISREALDDHFSATGHADDVLAAFKKGQARILDVAVGVHGKHSGNLITLISNFFN